MTVRYTIEAKPTTYNGVNFRSRLEARWAAFFDSMNTRYVYEPIDLGAWSPDFMRDDNEGRVLCEVKPIYQYDNDVARKMSDALHDQQYTLEILGINPLYWWHVPSGSSIGERLQTKGGDTVIKLWNEAGNLVQWQLTGELKSSGSILCELAVQNYDKWVPLLGLSESKTATGYVGYAIWTGDPKPIKFTPSGVFIGSRRATPTYVIAKACACDEECAAEWLGSILEVKDVA